MSDIKDGNCECGQCSTSVLADPTEIVKLAQEDIYEEDRSEYIKFRKYVDVAHWVTIKGCSSIIRSVSPFLLQNEPYDKVNGARIYRPRRFQVAGFDSRKNEVILYVGFQSFMKCCELNARGFDSYISVPFHSVVQVLIADAMVPVESLSRK